MCVHFILTSKRLLLCESSLFMSQPILQQVCIGSAMEEHDCLYSSGKVNMRSSNYASPDCNFYVKNIAISLPRIPAGIALGRYRIDFPCKKSVM